jgi:hypothetical protein
MPKTNQIDTKRVAASGDVFKIVEGIMGQLHYHLAMANADGYHSLCGKDTMNRSVRIDSWGFYPKHMPTSYCKECERMAIESLERERVK